MDLLDPDLDINAAASLLKLYLRTLSSEAGTPLFPVDMYEEYMQAMSLGSQMGGGEDEDELYDTRLILIKTLVQRTPPHVYTVLEFLMRHLARVVAHSDVNLMAAENLGIVFGPSLLWAPGGEASGFANLSLHNALVGDILSQVDWIFDGSPD